MSTFKEKVFIAASAGVLATTAVAALQPPSPKDTEADRRRQQIERGVGDLADAQGRVAEQLRRDGEQLQQADHEDRLRPGEHRPPDPHIRIRVLP